MAATAQFAECPKCKAPVVLMGVGDKWAGLRCPACKYEMQVRLDPPKDSP